MARQKRKYYVAIVGRQLHDNGNMSRTHTVCGTLVVVLGKVKARQVALRGKYKKKTLTSVAPKL